MDKIGSPVYKSRLKQPGNKYGKDSNNSSSSFDSYSSNNNNSRPTSAEVIKQAKQWCNLKAIETRRPATPREATRLWYGSSGSRPPSSLSIDPSQFDPNDRGSRPSSGTHVKSKLMPLNHKPLVPNNTEPLVKPQITPESKVAGDSVGELLIKKMTRQIPPRSPMKAVHSGGSVTEKGEEVKSRYHPTPPLSKYRTTRSPKDALKKVEHPSPPNSSKSSKSDRRRSPHSGGGSAGSGLEETEDEAYYWNKTVLPIIEILEDFMSRDIDDLCSACEQLYSVLKAGNCFGHIPHRRRTSLLSALFKLLQLSSHDIHLLCVRIILQVGVKNNLTSVCKLLFRICREQTNDHLFVKYELLGPMLNILSGAKDPISKYEALIYLTGSLNFLSLNKEISLLMYEEDCIEKLTTFMDDAVFIIKTQPDLKKNYKFTVDLLIQTTSLLRTMVDVDKRVQRSHNSIHTLVAVLQVFGREEKIVWNISRLLSKLTMYPAPMPYFASTNEWVGTTLQLIENFQSSLNITVRLCFALGNLASRNNQIRENLFFNQRVLDSTTDESDCLSVLLAQISNCMAEEDTNNHHHSTDTEQDSSNTKTEVLIKVVRVIANLSLSERVGPCIASNDNCIDQLLRILERFDLDEREDLILNVLATLNNLSYYNRTNNTNKENAISNNRLRLAAILFGLIKVDHMLCVGEVAGVFGNLTCHKDVRDLLHKHKIDLMMVALLDSGDRQVVYNACGVLVNISSDHEKRLYLVQERTISKLIDVLHEFAPSDWRMGGVSCQLIWNICSGIDDVDDHDSMEEINGIMDVLDAFLDPVEIKERISSMGLKPENQANLMSSWKEEFVVYAQPLFDFLPRKFAVSQSNLVPLDRPIENNQSDSDNS